MQQIAQTEPFAFPSLIRDLPFETYLAIEAASASGIKTMLAKSPKHVREEPHKESDAMTLGTLAHEMILEPEARRYIVLREDAGKTSNAAKGAYVASLCDAMQCDSPDVEKAAFGKMLDQAIELLTAKAAEDGRYIVTLDQHAQASKMYEAVMANPLARIIIEDCESEVTMLANDPETGCPVKGRADIWCTGHDLIGDIKTTDSAGYEDYSRACGKFQLSRPGRALSMARAPEWKRSRISPYRCREKSTAWRSRRQIRPRGHRLWLATMPDGISEICRVLSLGFLARISG